MRQGQGNNVKAGFTNPAIVELLMAMLFLHFLLFPVDAQVVTDGSVGPAVSLPGPDYNIGADLGSQAGSNLFHSFDRFSIGHSESAVFTGPEDIKNVISRVTGGGVSNIDGLLRSEVGRADFYFINPAGVVFGENARVDVPAAFYLSTADELRFSDGAVFSAANPEKSALTMVQPETFGFLSPQPASITVNGSLLDFKPGNTVSLSAGDLGIRGSEESPARLIAEGGEIHLTAVGQTMEDLPVSGESSGDAGGALVMENAMVSAGGDGGGLITIRAGEARLAGSNLSTDNTGDGNAEGGIYVEVAGPVELFGGAHISTDAYGAGDAGGVMIEAQELKIDGQGLEDRLTVISSDAHSTGNAGTVALKVAGSMKMVDGAVITSSTFASGDAGSVTVEVAERLEMVDGAEISSNTFGKGNAGSVKIKTVDLSMKAVEGQFAGIISVADTDSTGTAGSVAVEAGGLLEMIERAEISSSTFSSGDAGSVKIEARELRIDGRELEGQFTGIASIASSGDGGTVEVKASQFLELRNGALITASAFGSGDAGNVTVEAPGLLNIVGGAEISSGTFSSGDAGGVKISAGDLRLDGQELEDRFTSINSTTESDGNAGTVEVNATGLIEIVNKAEISTSTFGSGKAGSVKIEALNLKIDGRGLEDKFTGIASLASTGDGGTVEVKAGESLEMVDGAQITCAAYGSGDAGSVMIETSDLQIDGQGCEKLTGIASTVDPGASGLVGDIGIKAGNVELSHGGAISIAHMGELTPEKLTNFEGGELRIQADMLKLEADSEVRASSTGKVPASSIEMNIAHGLIVEGSSRITTSAVDGDGGDIMVSGADYVLLQDGVVTTSSEGGLGGDIVLTPKNLVLDTGFIQANTIEGARGGDIFIGAEALIPEGGRLQVGGDERLTFTPGSGMNVIQAAAPGGEKGNIVITAPEMDISASLVDMGVELAVPVRLTTDPCLTRGRRGGSALVHYGRGGIPEAPGDPSTVDRLDRLLAPNVNKVDQVD